MEKIFNVIIEIAYWILLFLSPFIGGVIIAFIVYCNNPSNHWLPLGIVLIGIILGTILAERIRRKYGTSAYMGSITGFSESKDDALREKNSDRPTSK